METSIDRLERKRMEITCSERDTVEGCMVFRLFAYCSTFRRSNQHAPASLLSSFPHQTSKCIKNMKQVATQLSTPDLQDLCYIYMVGGFCASPLLQDAIREEFDDPGRDLKVVVAPRPGLAVVSCLFLFLLPLPLLSM